MDGKHGVFTSLPSDDRDFPRDLEKKRVFRFGNEIFREITRKIKVVTRQGGKNSGFSLWEWFSNEAKMLIEIFI